MTPSDFLMLISIVLAIVAIAAANNKKIWLYKFATIEKYIAILVSLVVLCLIWYDGIITHLNFIKYEWFYCERGLNSRTWAFIIAVLMLFVFIVRVSIQTCFPKSRREDLVQYYKRLIHSDINLLIEYLYQYHFHEGSIDSYLLSIYTDKTFIRKSINIDQSLFLKLLISDNGYEERRITYGSVGFYTRLVVSDVSGLFLQELSELDAYYIVNSIEEPINSQIERFEIFESLFKDKTYAISSMVLSSFHSMATEQILHSRYYDEETAVFLGSDNVLFFNKYIQLYFVILCYYITNAENNSVSIKSCYSFSSFSYLLPIESDSENRIANKKRMIEYVDMHYDILIYYCEKHNYTKHLSFLIYLRLSMFCNNYLLGYRYEDVWALIKLYIERNVAWVNIDNDFKQLLKEIIDQEPQFHKKMAIDIITNKDSCIFPDRIHFLLSLLSKEQLSKEQ